MDTVIQEKTNLRNQLAMAKETEKLGKAKVEVDRLFGVKEERVEDHSSQEMEKEEDCSSEEMEVVEACSFLEMREVAYADQEVNQKQMAELDLDQDLEVLTGEKVALALNL